MIPIHNLTPKFCFTLTIFGSAAGYADQALHQESTSAGNSYYPPAMAAQSRHQIRLKRIDGLHPSDRRRSLRASAGGLRPSRGQRQDHVRPRGV